MSGEKQVELDALTSTIERMAERMKVTFIIDQEKLDVFRSSIREVEDARLETSKK